MHIGILPLKAVLSKCFSFLSSFFCLVLILSEFYLIFIFLYKKLPAVRRALKSFPISGAPIHALFLNEQDDKPGYVVGWSSI